MGGRKEVDEEKSNCNYPSILVNIGTNPTVLCWLLSPNQCLILPRSTFLLRNFFADVLLIPSPLVGNSKENTTISALYFPKKAPNFSFQKYLLGLLSPLQKKKKKKHILFFVDPRFSISNHPFGEGGGGCYYGYLFMSEYINPRGSDTGLFHFSMPPVCTYTHVC